MATEKTKRLDGFLEAVKTFISTDKAKKSKLVEWVKKYDEALAQQAEIERLEEALPGEIDALLKSGDMSEKTIEQLARKRAHLDLIPARYDNLSEKLEALENEFESASLFVDEAVRNASQVFFDRQMERAVSDLMALGVSKDIAERQAEIREDIQAIDPQGVAHLCGGFLKDRCRRLLWAYESFEAGLHPRSPEAEKFQKKWCPNG